MSDESPLRHPYRELSDERDDGSSLYALVHGDVGFLMYLREPGDSGFTSRNPAYAGPKGAVIDYVLGNGQRDEYPAAWAVSIEMVERAMAYFREEGGMAPFVAWHED